MAKSSWPNWNAMMKGFNETKPFSYNPRPGTYGYDQYYQKLYARAIVNDAVRKAVAQGVKSETANIMKLYASHMYESMDQELAQFHKELVKGAQQAILAAYEESGIGSRPSYRQNDRGRMRRYAGGKMLSALASPSLMTSSATGIGLFKKSFLDSRAKQWYRLNFGALPMAQRRGAYGSIKMLGVTSSKRITLDRYGPSRPFYVPHTVSRAGLWSNKFLASNDLNALRSARSVKTGTTGKGALYVVPASFEGSFRPVISRGIRGARFLDAGVAYINNNYGPGIVRVFKKHHQKAVAKAKAGQRPAKVAVKPRYDKKARSAAAKRGWEKRRQTQSSMISVRPWMIKANDSWDYESIKPLFKFHRIPKWIKPGWRNDTT